MNEKIGIKVTEAEVRMLGIYDIPSPLIHNGVHYVVDRLAVPVHGEAYWMRHHEGSRVVNAGERHKTPLGIRVILCPCTEPSSVTAGMISASPYENMKAERDDLKKAISFLQDGINTARSDLARAETVAANAVAARRALEKDNETQRETIKGLEKERDAFCGMATRFSARLPTAPKQYVEAWHQVFDACIEMGMRPVANISHEKTMLKFIQNLKAERDSARENQCTVSERSKAAGWDYVWQVCMQNGMCLGQSTSGGEDVANFIKGLRTKLNKIRTEINT